MKLRQRVKSGELTAREALEWINSRPYQRPSIVEWLVRRIIRLETGAVLPSQEKRP